MRFKLLDDQYLDFHKCVINEFYGQNRPCYFLTDIGKIDVDFKSQKIKCHDLFFDFFDHKSLQAALSEAYLLI